MRISDREIALSMRYMKDADRSLLLALVAPEKRKRIMSELLLHKRLVIRADQYRKAIEHLIGLIKEERYGGSLGSYLRPVRRGSSV